MRQLGGTWQRCPFLWAFIPLPLPLCSHLLVLGHELGHLRCCSTNLGLGAAPVCKPLQGTRVGLAVAGAKQEVMLLLDP